LLSMCRKKTLKSYKKIPRSEDPPERGEPEGSDYESIYACGALSNKSYPGIRSAYLQVRRVGGSKDKAYDRKEYYFNIRV